jgi:hypothetical protein
MILGCIEVLAESYTLAEKSGIATNDLQHFVKGIILYHSQIDL